jgi:hypothetical protein
MRKGKIMSSTEKALETQLKNIQSKTGKTLDQLYALIKKSGLTKHGEIRDMLKTGLGMGHGDANTVIHFYFKAADESTGKAASSPEDVISEIYSGGKTELRPIHDRLMAAINKFGAFEIAPKKGYISLRRKKQFAMIGPATKTRVEVGLNMKGVKGTARLLEMKPGGMCQYKINLTDAKEVDQEVIGWIRQAYDSAG